MRTFFAFLISSLLLILADFLGWSRPVKAWVANRTNPIQQVVYQKITNYKLKIKNFRQSPQKITGLKQRLGELERENAELKIENWKLSIENANSRRLLAAPLALEWSFLPAKVLGSNRYLLIDKGRRDGVEPEMIAVFEKSLVGRVVAVGERTAKISLPTDRESEIMSNVKCQMSNVCPVEGRLVGTGKEMLLTQVPQADKFAVDDLVVTSGREEIFPPNLLIGTVASISQDERQPTQQAEIKPLLDYSQLETVFLLL